MEDHTLVPPDWEKIDLATRPPCISSPTQGGGFMVVKMKVNSIPIIPVNCTTFARQCQQIDKNMPITKVMTITFCCTLSLFANHASRVLSDNSKWFACWVCDEFGYYQLEQSCIPNTNIFMVWFNGKHDWHSWLMLMACHVSTHHLMWIEAEHFLVLLFGGVMIN